MAQRTFVQNFNSRLQSSLVIFSFLWLSVAFFWLYRAVTLAGQKIDFFCRDLPLFNDPLQFSGFCSGVH